MEAEQKEQTGNKTWKKRNRKRNIFLWTAGIILGLLLILYALFQLLGYLMFLPEYPITRADKRAVIEYCENKYHGKAVIKESEAIQYGVDRTRFDKYTVQMDSDVFHVNVSVSDFDWMNPGPRSLHKNIIGDDRQLDQIQEAMVDMLIDRMSLPEPDRVVFRAGRWEEYDTSIETYYDGSNIREVYNKEGIDAIFLYKDIDLSQYQDQRGILPYDSVFGEYFGHLLLCEVTDPEIMNDYGNDEDTVIDVLEYTAKFDGEKFVEIVRHGPLE